MGFKFNFKKLLPYAIGTGAGALSNQFKATQPFSAAISAGAGALADKGNRFGGALKGFAGGGMGTALSQGLQSKTGFGSGAMEGLKQYGSSIPGFKGVGTANPTGAMAKFFTPQSIQNPGGTASNKVAGAMNVAQGTPFGQKSAAANLHNNVSNALMGTPAKTSISPFSSTPPIKASSPAPSGMVNNIVAGGGKKTIMDSFGGMLPGMGMSMIGELLSPEVKDPDFESALGPARANLATGPNAKATSYYESLLNPGAGFVDSTPGLAVDKLAHDKQIAETLRSFDQQWQGAMGGQDPSNNSEYQRQRAKILQDAESSWTANQSQFQFQYDQLQKQQQMQAAAALSNLDQSQQQAIIQLAQLDLQTIMYKTGLEAGEAQQFKDMFGSMGSMMMQNAQNENDPLRQAQLAYYQKALAGA